MGPVSTRRPRVSTTSGCDQGRYSLASRSVSELAGGILTVTGVADPLGPIVLAGTMAVASSTHRANGPFTAKGGFELPLTNMAAALALAVTGPGRLSIDALTGRRLPTPITRVVTAGAVAVAAASLAMVLRNTPPPAPEKQADETSSGEADTPTVTDTATD